MHRLDRPTLLDKSRGEVIQELGVRWTLPKLSEVAGRAYDALAEMRFPDAIHDHSRRERIAWADDRLGQLQPPAALGETRGLAVAQDAQISPRRNFSQARRFPADRNP